MHHFFLIGSQLFCFGVRNLLRVKEKMKTISIKIITLFSIDFKSFLKMVIVRNSFLLLFSQGRNNFIFKTYFWSTISSMSNFNSKIFDYYKHCN